MVRYGFNVPSNESDLLRALPVLCWKMFPNVAQHQLFGSWLVSCALSQGVNLGFIRFRSSMAGSSLGSCGKSLPWMARSRILDLACAIDICKSSFADSRVSIKVNHLSTVVTMRNCSSWGGNGNCIVSKLYFGNPSRPLPDKIIVAAK